MTGIELINQILKILKSSDTVKRYESVISRFEQRKEQLVLCQYFGHKKSNFFMLYF